MYKDEAVWAAEVEELFEQDIKVLIVAHMLATRGVEDSLDFVKQIQYVWEDFQAKQVKSALRELIESDSK